MYTQCPHCGLAFRVTASDLRRAVGQVPCSGCGREFNALQTLTEDRPRVAEDPDALLRTLNELTGDHEIRIEDTGVEWRVIDEDEADEEPVGDAITRTCGTPDEHQGLQAGDEEAQPPAPAEADSGSTSSVRWYLDEPAGETASSLDTAAQDAQPAHTVEPANGGDVAGEAAPSPPHFDLDVQRYDDNTPLPDDFEEEEEEPRVFMRRAEDQVEPRSPEADEAQVDLALGEPDDWMDLLDEVAQRNEAAASAADHPPDPVAAEAPPQLAATDEELPDAAPSVPASPAAREDAPDEAGIGGAEESLAEAEDAGDEEELIDDFPADIDTQFDLQALELGIDLSGSRNLSLEEEYGEEEPPGKLADEASPEETRARDDDRAAAPPAEQERAAAAFEEAAAIGEQELATDHAPGDEDSDEAEARRLEEAFERELAAAWSTSTDEATPDETATHAPEAPADVASAESRKATSQESDESGESVHYVPPQTEEEMTINRLIDQDLIRLAEQQGDFTSTRAHGRLDEAPHVETIIMEGDFVRTALEGDLASGADDNAANARKVSGGAALVRDSGAPATRDDDDDFPGTYVKSSGHMRGGRRRTDPASYRVLGGVAVLLLVLAAQVVHAYRESLATYPAFDRTIGSVYRLLGEPLNPDWNIKEWQFEATSGRTDDSDDVLTISSRLANGSSRPLPYPLLHVSLTDRWEEIIGSKILEPGDYLDGNADPGARVPPGERFTALVRVESPSPEATGFKLNVCYREPGNRVRCATEDFKN